MNLMDAFIEYINQYLEFATLTDRTDFYRPDKTYKRNYRDVNTYLTVADKESKWATMNFLLLCKYTARLNEFAKLVRTYYDPYYHCTRGSFIIEDTLGTHLGEWYTRLLPDINEIEQKIADLK